MMIQIQNWESSQKIIIVDEINHGTRTGGDTKAWTIQG